MGIEEQIDRLIDLGEDIKSRLDRLVEAASDHFVGAGKMVAEEPPKKWRILEPGEVVQEGDWVNAIVNKPDEDPPGGGWVPARASVIGGEASQAMGLYVARPVLDEAAKEPEPKHPAGPKPDPGEGYRLLSKDPPEDLAPGDERESNGGKWVESINARRHRKQAATCWYRRKIETAKQPEPAWEPKVGDWVKVTRPGDWIEWEHPRWEGFMHQFDGKVGQIECEWGGHFQIRGFAASNGFRYQFHRDWLSPATTSQPLKLPPPQPEYREPVLPADVGKECEFSDDSISWEEGVLIGWRANFNTFNWKSERDSHRYARIKKES